MRNVLILGGAGFFGRALAVRLLKTDVERIAIFSRNEHAQAAMKAASNDSRLRWLIGDIRDSERLWLAMDGVDTVIHAAALKRIEVCESNPMEATATNVYGTENVIRGCFKAGVDALVYLSTDKAVQATTHYGKTKAAAESSVLESNAYSRTRCNVTRYGNVAGSTGSVIPIWREILKTGDTVPVTSPYCTRFWMTVQEAVDLVLETVDAPAGTLATPELPAYLVEDLAIAMGARIKVIGMGRKEKLHERMTDDGPDSSQVRRMSIIEIREALQHV